MGIIRNSNTQSQSMQYNGCIVFVNSLLYIWIDLDKYMQIEVKRTAKCSGWMEIIDNN